MAKVSGRRPGGTAATIANQIRIEIREQRLMPGEHIRQDEWARTFGVSRLPVREALQTLASEGMLTHSVRRGYFVAKIAREEMIQIYRMRLLLEPEAVREIRAATPSELERIVGFGDACEEALGRQDPPRALGCDREQYFAVLELSDDNVIVAELRRLWTMSEAYRVQAFHRLMFGSEREEHRAMHAEINAAVADGDGARLGSAYREARRRALAYFGADA